MTKLRARGGATAAALLPAVLLAGCGTGTAEPPARATLAGSGTDAAQAPECADVVGPGYTEVAHTSDEVGTTSFWAKGRRWVVCDVAGDTDPVLIGPFPGRQAGFDERSLALSSTSLDGAVRYVAGGRLPWPVDELTYTFPDEHTQTARLVAEEGEERPTWWVVAYTVTDGPLLEAESDETDLGPVTVEITGEAAEAFRVPWEDLQRSE